MKKEDLVILKNSIVIFKDKNGKIELQADIEKETIWATQTQIAELFVTTKQNVGLHIKNIFKDKELPQDSVVKEFLTTAADRKEYIVKYYNLDAIIAVGYRVNSKKATQFRIWATTTLREYLVNGLVVNEKRLEALHTDSIKDIENKVLFIQETIRNRQLDQPEIDGILSVINGYAHSWLFLKKYDEGVLQLPKARNKEKDRQLFHFEYDFVKRAIQQLKRSLLEKEEASEIFGNEMEASFKGILGNIYQTFDGNELYVSLEEKAAHLFYLIIKDHPFTDGNKRIASFLFIYFLDSNRILLRPNGEKKINDNAVVALALLIAESDPNLKDVMIAVVVNMLF